MSAISNLLLTGASGVGKPTLLREVGMSLEGAKVRGFSADVRWDGKECQGWRLDAFDGSDGGVLIHRDIQLSGKWAVKAWTWVLWNAWFRVRWL